VNIFSNEFDLFCVKHGIIHERMSPYSSQSNGVGKRKNHTLTDLLTPCWTLLDYLRHGGDNFNALLTSCHVLNRVFIKNKEKTSYEEWIERKPSLSYLCRWGCLAKVNAPINKKRKLGSKIVDCVFLGYVHHSIVYRFLVIKSEVSDVHVDTFLEYHDVTFFENIFPMKKLYDMSSLPANVIVDTTPRPSGNFDHDEHTPKLIHEEIDSEAPRRGKRSRNVKSFSDDFIVYLMYDTPKTILEAFASLDADDWKETTHSEIDSVLSNGT
jgi:hypothetical protein